MKFRLPPHILRTLIAAFALSFATSTQAQSSQLQSWENVTLPEKGTYILSLDDGQSPAPVAITSLKYLQLADGSTPTFHPDATHVSEKGELLSSSDPSSYIEDPETGLRVMMAGLAVTTEEITFRGWVGYTTFEVGTIVLGGHYGIDDQGDISPMINRDFQVSDYAQFSTATSSEIYVDNLWGYGPTFSMGKTNQSWGSATTPVSTNAIFNLSYQHSESISFKGVTGGNVLNAQASADTTFYGTSTIILLNESYAGTIVGGNLNMENASYRASFVGDVKISIQDEAGADIIIGGNSGHGGDFTGDVDIAIHSSAGAVTGANRLYAASDTTFTGNTNILVTSALTERETLWLYGDIFAAYNSIIGGYATETAVSYSVYAIEGVRPPYTSSHAVNYEGTTAQLTGTTNIELNFENKYTTTAASVNQAIVGGSLVTAGLNLNHDGGSKITITGAENVKFYRWVVGGNLVNDISNGAYYDKGTPFPYVDRNNMATAYIESVEINVDSGDFTKIADQDIRYDEFNVSSLFTVGSMSAGGGNVETGSTKATITGGTFNTIVGGNTSIASMQDFDGKEIEDYSSGATIVGDVNLSISGESTSAELVIGGSYLSDSITGVQGLDAVTKEVIFLEHAASVGDVNVNITGGYIGAVTSGSYVGQNIANAKANGDGYLVTQGNLKLSLTGQSVLAYGVVAGAGIINGFGGALNPQIVEIENTVDYYYSSLEKQLGISLGSGSFDPSTLTPEQIASITPPPSYAATIDPSVPTTQEMAVRVVTESTSVELGSEVEFLGETIISGGYVGIPSGSQEGVGSEAMEKMSIFYALQDAFQNPSTPEEQAMLDWVNSWIAALNADAETIQGMALQSGGITAPHIDVTGNRELVFSDQATYNNLANTRIIEFDEVETARGAVVDFAQNGQDLDSLGGRNSLSADGIHVIQDDFNGTNTLRKTGQGVLKLSDTNGQINGQDNLQLVVEEGTVVLAQNSASVDKTNFKTLVVQTGATLDMKAGDNTEAGAAGINGHLNLEQGAILVADASRYIADSGTSMDAGKLTVNMDFILKLDNTDKVQPIALREVTFTEALPAGTSVANNFALGIFEIVLFSDLVDIEGISFYDASWGGDSVQIAFAGDYISQLSDLPSGESLFVGNDNNVWESYELYLVWMNNDLILTSGAALFVPEPSTATLSLLALAGLLARRRRKAA